ncbi:hypothetical protein ACFL35_04840 [Candidatus Riflebacteria bacterium]
MHSLSKKAGMDLVLLSYCLIVMLEFVIIAFLTGRPWIVLFALVVFPATHHAVTNFEPGDETEKEASNTEENGRKSVSAEKEKAAFFLFVEGRDESLELTPGLKITQNLLCGQSLGLEKPIAEVSQKPGADNILGLSNLTDTDWVVQFPAGKRKVEPGRTVAIEDGMLVHFGEFNGSVKWINLEQKKDE